MATSRKSDAATSLGRARARAVCPALYECTSRPRVRAPYYVRTASMTAAAAVTFMRSRARAYLSRSNKVYT